MDSKKITTVLFAPLRREEPKSAINNKIEGLCRAAALENIIGDRDYVALKVHFGESKNRTHVPPHCIRPIVACVKKCGGHPFLTDTNVLYRSQRSNAISHLQLVEDHGFSLRNTGAPVIIGDGLLGNSEVTVKIPGKIFSEVALASEIMLANALIAISHVTGHMNTGMGAALKNLGMGIASRKGKLRQHSAIKPQIKSEKCTACEECVRWCPENTIEMRGGVAFIKSERCTGCGECLTVCRFEAVRYNWGVESEELQRRVAEHALGAIIQRREKSLFFNFLTSITRDCDCIDASQQPLMEDIGILVSQDPVAIDKASLDLIRRTTGKSLSAFAYPQLDGLTQLRHGEEIGLGTMSYNLVEIN